jgi:hypothetical protein
MPGWRGEELLHSTMNVGQLPRYSARLFLPACFWPARIADQSAVRAGGRKAARNGGNKKIACMPSLRANDEFGGGEGQGYFASGAGGVGSIPPGSKDPVAQWIERLMSLAGSSRPAV